MRIKNLVSVVSFDCMQDFCNCPFLSRSVWFILVINVAKALIMLTLYVQVRCTKFFQDIVSFFQSRIKKLN